MADALRDVQCREACVDEQGNMRVADIMRADLADTGCLAAHPELEEQIVARPLKQPAVRADMLHADVDQDLVQQKLRDPDITYTFLGLRGGDDVLPVDLRVRFCDVDHPARPVNILRGQRQQLALAHAGPVEDLKGGESFRIRRKMADKLLVFLQCPDTEFLSGRPADMSCLRAGIGKIIVALGVVHHRGQLKVDQLLVSGAVVLPENDGLPLADMLCGDALHGQRAKERQDLFGKNVLLGRQGGRL